MKSDHVYELQKSLLNMEPLDGSMWMHYGGDIYKVVMKAVESNEPHRIKVIYRSEEYGYLWEHSLEEWKKLIELADGTLVRRFKPFYGRKNLSEHLEEQWDC